MIQSSHLEAGNQHLRPSVRQPMTQTAAIVRARESAQNLDDATADAQLCDTPSLL